jgi:hypothetical protein
VYQAINSIVDGTTYETSFQVVSRTQGNVKINVAGSTGTARESAATYTEDISGGATPAVCGCLGGSLFSGTVDNVSIKEKNKVYLR